jgi:hypothetical protein
MGPVAGKLVLGAPANPHGSDHVSRFLETSQTGSGTILGLVWGVLGLVSCFFPSPWSEIPNTSIRVEHFDKSRMFKVMKIAILAVLLSVLLFAALPAFAGGHDPDGGHVGPSTTLQA